MSWRDDITPEQQRRLEQIENYDRSIGYEDYSDLKLLCIIAEIADTKEWLAGKRLEALNGASVLLDRYPS